MMDYRLIIYWDAYEITVYEFNTYEEALEKQIEIEFKSSEIAKIIVGAER